MMMSLMFGPVMDRLVLCRRCRRRGCRRRIVRYGLVLRYRGGRREANCRDRGYDGFHFLPSCCSGQHPLKSMSFSIVPLPHQSVSIVADLPTLSEPPSPPILTKAKAVQFTNVRSSTPGKGGSLGNGGSAISVRLSEAPRPKGPARGHVSLSRQPKEGRD